MSKSHLEIFNIFFIFQNKSSTRWGVGEPSFVGNESDGHKMCFSELRGLFYILWHEDTERRPPPGPWQGSLLASLGCRRLPCPCTGTLTLPEETSARAASLALLLTSQSSPLSLPDLTLLDKSEAVEAGGLTVGPGFPICNLQIWVKSSGPQGASCSLFDGQAGGGNHPQSS